MIQPATQKIAEVFDVKDVKYTVTEMDDEEKGSFIQVTFSAENINSICCKMFSHNDGSSVAFRVFDIVKVPEDKTDKVLPVINQLNCSFRYMKVCLESDNTVTAGYDFPEDIDEEIGELVYELMLMLVRVIDDEVYPALMKAIWA